MEDYGRTTLRNAALRPIPIKVSGVYRITNAKNGKIYIGSAGNIRRRLCVHLNMLREGNHTSPHLQRAFNRDGEGVFVFDVLVLCSKGDLLKREQEFLDLHRSYHDKNGYNVCKVAGSGPSVVFTDEMRSVISVRFKGKPKSAEHRLRIGEAQKIRTCSPEMRERIRAKVREYWDNPEMRAAQSARKLGKTHKGTPHTAESKKKLSLAKKGKCAHNKGIPHTEEAKRKMSVSNTGKRLSEETKRKMSLARTGKPKKKTGPLSDEHKNKLSAALLGRPNLKKRKHVAGAIEAWIKLRMQGKSFWMIAKEVNVAPGVICKTIKRYLKEHPDAPHDTEQRQGMAQCNVE